MTDVTEEARKELKALERAGLFFTSYDEQQAMLALDKHHGRTPPDPMVAKAERLLEVLGWKPSERFFGHFVAELKRMFPDG